MKDKLTKGQFPTFKLPREVNGWNRVPGQVPTKEDRQIVKYAMKKPKPFKASMLLDHTEPRLSIDHVLDGLGFDQGEYNSWKKFLQKALTQENEVVMRQDLISKMREESLDASLARALLQRSLMYRKGQLIKSTEVYSPDMIRDMLLKAEVSKRKYELEGHPEVIEELDKLLLAMSKCGQWGTSRDLQVSIDGDGPHWLRINNGVPVKLDKQSIQKELEQTKVPIYSLKLEKADPKGGSYYRRVPKKVGKGFTYYYDEDKYKRSKNAHIKGEDAANSYIQKTVFTRAGNEKGCDVKELKDLVKRYGSKAVGSSLKDAHKSGKLTFKKGKLYYKEVTQETKDVNKKSG